MGWEREREEWEGREGSCRELKGGRMRGSNFATYRWILLARSVRKYFRALCDKITQNIT